MNDPQYITSLLQSASAGDPEALDGVWTAIHADVPEGTIEQISVLVQLIFEQRLSQGLLHLALAGVRVLPAVEPHMADELVEVVHHPLEHDRESGTNDSS